MRIRNGADFVESTIRSHIDCFDEVVAVHNQCTDGTPDILARLQREFGRTKLRVLHYADRVFPQGTEGHAKTDATSTHSVVNYSNFALAATRYQFATKLDDDHLAIAEPVNEVCDLIRGGHADPGRMYCFSGLNLIRDPDNGLAVLANDPISGSGDIGFFPVSSETYFFHDRRFERFQRGGLKRHFAGFQYWHLKYLKTGMGFGNYELETNPDSRFAKRKVALTQRAPRRWTLDDLAYHNRPSVVMRMASLVSDKAAFLCDRDTALRGTFPETEVNDALRRTVRDSILADPALADRLGFPHSSPRSLSA